MGKSVQPGSGPEFNSSTKFFGESGSDTDLSKVMYSGPKQDFGVQVPANDLVRRVRESAAQQVGGASGFRMAGDRLSPMTSTSSMAEESTRLKYSPETTSKSPSSQYLSYSASPYRLGGS